MPSLCLPPLLLVVAASLCSCTCRLAAVLDCHDGVNAHASDIAVCQVRCLQALAMLCFRLFQDGSFCNTLVPGLSLRLCSFPFAGVELGLQGRD